MSTLMDMGVEISRSTREFVADGISYPRGTPVVFASQHCRPYIISLLKRTFYHVGAFSKKPDDTPIVPYDLSTYTIAEFMGVRLHEVKKPFSGSFETLSSIRYPRGGAAKKAPYGWLLDISQNDGFKAVNRVLRRGLEVHRILETAITEEGHFGKGSFYIPHKENLENELDKLARRLHLRFYASPEIVKSKQVKMLRIGMYQRYWGGNADEGWTRWLLEQYRFRYRTLMDEDIKKGKLAKKYDVIIIPSDSKELILGKDIEKYFEDRWGKGFTMPNYPPEYKSGLGEEGVEKLKEFVEEGGTLITFGDACNFAIEEMGLSIENVLKDVSQKEFVCPGSTLHVNVHDHELAYGVQRDLLIVFRHHPAFSVKPRVNNEDYQVVISYPEKRIMQSGWLTGEEHLSHKAALIEAKKGKGKIILYGFQPQMRAQTDATFKLFFNALLG